MTKSGEEVLAEALAASKARRAKKAAAPTAKRAASGGGAATPKKRGRPAKEKVDSAAVEIANEEAAEALAARAAAGDDEDAPVAKKPGEKTLAQKLAERQGPCGAVSAAGCSCLGWSAGRTVGYWESCAGCGHTQHVHAVGPAAEFVAKTDEAEEPVDLAAVEDENEALPASVEAEEVEEAAVAVGVVS